MSRNLNLVSISKLITSALFFGIILSLYLFLKSGIVFAQAEQASQSAVNLENIRVESVNPGDDTAFLLKRLKEKFFLVLYTPFPEKRVDYYLTLIDVRLAELNNVVKRKDIANIQTTTQRYATTAGELSDYINQKKLDSHKRKAKELLNNHLLYLNEMKKAYDDTTAEWRFVEHDVNYIKIYLDRLN